VLGWVLSAKRTFPFARNSASEEFTGRREFAANEYTPASVGPEMILRPAASSMACSSTRVTVGENTARITSSGARAVDVVTV
jgi:hypothetical protein